MAAPRESMTTENSSLEKASLNPAESMVPLHTFSDTLLNNQVHFHVMKLDHCFFLWIGNQDKLDNLAVAMKTKFDKTPCATDIMGDASDSSSASLSQKFASRTGKQVFVSCQLPPDNILLPEVEKRVIQELKDHPEHF